MKHRMVQLVLLLQSIYIRSMLSRKNVKFGKNIHLYGIPCVRNKGSIVIGDDVTIQSDIRFAPTSFSGVTFLTTYPSAVIKIASNSGLSCVKITARSSIEIGRHTLIGTDTKIIDSNMHPSDYEKRRIRDNDKEAETKPIIIGDDVFIGTSCIILKGVSIGDRSIVAAGSVVTTSIPSDEIWGGNPARKIKSISVRCSGKNHI